MLQKTAFYENTRKNVGSFIDRNPKFSALTALILGYKLNQYLNNAETQAAQYAYGNKYASVNDEMPQLYKEMASAELDAINKEVAAFVLEKQAAVLRAATNNL